MRIRTIKPEFWASESVGRLSRDARLLFVGFWSLADDSGRGRGALPTISGSLFPYDSDAQKLLPKWIAELQAEGMVRLYKAEDGNTYFDIPNWLKHQKIEKPSAPKFPPFTEQLGNRRGIVGEGSPLDQGSGIRDQGGEQGPGTLGNLIRSAVTSPATDVEWLESLKRNPAYDGIDVGLQFGRCAQWCEANKKQNTRRRFVNWLNRIDKPLEVIPRRDPNADPDWTIPEQT